MKLLLISLLLVSSQLFPAAEASAFKVLIAGDPTAFACQVMAHKKNKKDVKIYCYVPTLAVPEKVVLVRRMLRAYGIQKPTSKQEWGLATELFDRRNFLMIAAGFHPSDSRWGNKAFRAALDKIVAQEEQANKPATASMPPAQTPAVTAASAVADPLDTAAPDKTNK